MRCHGRLNQANGIGRSVLTFQKLRTSRRPPVWRLASRCASNRVSQPISNQGAARNRSRLSVTFPVKGTIVRSWDHGLNAGFGSTDEVCRPRLGFDANLNRDVTLR